MSVCCTWPMNPIELYSSNIQSYYPQTSIQGPNPKAPSIRASASPPSRNHKHSISLHDSLLYKLYYIAMLLMLQCTCSGTFGGVWRRTTPHRQQQYPSNTAPHSNIRTPMEPRYYNHAYLKPPHLITGSFGAFIPWE